MRHAKLSIQKPSPAAIAAFLNAQAEQPFSYAEVGASGGPPPRGFRLSEVRVRLGSGQQAWERGIEGLRRWRQFNLGWVQAVNLGWVQAARDDTPIEPGRVVGIVARAHGLWMLNACRIIEVFDDDTPQRRRFGFAYGTLPAHAAVGEERFLVEWLKSDDSVWYTIRAFSRPRHPLAWLGYPAFRWSQRRFGRESSAAMLNQLHAAPA